MAYTLYYPSEAGYEYSTGYKCRWAITVTPDNDANTSAVSAQFQTYRADVNYYHRFTTVLTVGNTTVSYRIPGGTALSSVAGAVNAWVAFGSPVTTTVAHGADGTGSLIWKFTDPGDGYGAFGVSAASAYGTINTKIVVANLSTTITLNTIPRASTISSISSNVTTGSALALSVSRANPAFYHKATFKYGNTVLATSSAFATSLSYTVPHSWMSYATTATTMSITVSVQTYSSSACTETRGDPVTATFTVTAAASIAPAITAVTLSAYDSVSCTTAYVQGYSNVRAAITANNNACQGATINAYKVTVQNVTTSSSSATVTSSNKVTAAGTLTVTTTVTDTRGRSATRSDNITVLAYSAPVISGQSMFRCNASGVADEDGNYISLKATATVSGLNNTNTGTLTAAVGSTSYSMTSGTVRVVGTYDPDTTYTITFTLTDTVGTTVTYSRVLTTRVWAMNFASNGQGVAFGKACEVNKALAIPSDWDFYKGDYPSSKSLLNTLTEISSTGWTTLSGVASSEMRAYRLLLIRGYVGTASSSTRFNMVVPGAGFHNVAYYAISTAGGTYTLGLEFADANPIMRLVQNGAGVAGSVQMIQGLIPS